MTNVDMIASRPSYSRALTAFEKYKASRASKASPEETASLNEISRRLKRLENQVGELININNSMLATQVPQTEFDQDSDTVTFRWEGGEQKIKLKRADPNVPIQHRTVMAGGAYIPEHSGQDENVQRETQEMKMEALLEDYYQNAHKVLKLVKTLPGLRNVRCQEITMVRNWLVEHPKRGDVYSFGYGTSGPVVRPIQKSARQWNDSGLVPNTEAFVGKLTEAFERQVRTSG